MDEEGVQLSGRNLLDSLWFSQALHPLTRSGEWIGPGTQGDNGRTGHRAGRRKGLLHLPARKWADPGVLRPPGSEPNDQRAGRAPADLGSCPAPYHWVKPSEV